MGLIRSNLRRALLMAAIVGTVLVAINHWDQLRAGPMRSGLVVKCILSYAVPFVVSMVSAVLAAPRAK